MSSDPSPTAAPDSSSRDEHLWRDLLLLVEAGEIVPIVGRDLLQVGPPGAERHLYQSLAERVAVRLQVPFDAIGPSVDPLNAVACKYLERNDDARQIYISVYEEARALPALGLPTSLVKLAEIDRFKLFVTTIFDNSLQRAVDSVRSSGLKTDVRFFGRTKSRDLPGPLDDLPQPTVFHLLGLTAPTDDYVVTEEDALEWVHALQQAPPANLFKELHQKDLLVIGCRFPSWLVRSFIRLARKDRLRQSTGKTVFIVDSGAREDQTLIDFLRTFKTHTEVFAGDGPIEFVDKLHARWRQRPVDATGPVAQNLPAPGSIFLSYAAEDRAVAAAVARSLEAEKLDVWYDRDQLMAGDNFMEVIQAGIRRSDLFVPLLSRHSLAPGDRYFRREWACAFQKVAGLLETVKFILPAVLDDLPYNHEALPQQLKTLTWYPIANGVTPEFVATVKERYRKNQGN
jgi:hypothetical protein